MIKPVTKTKIEQIRQCLAGTGITTEKRGGEVLLTGGKISIRAISEAHRLGKLKLPYKIELHGDVYWDACDETPMEQSSIKVVGDLYIGDDTDIVVLPNQLTVFGNIIISNRLVDCQFPEWMFVDGDVDVSYTKEVRISAHTTITGLLSMNEYHFELPEHLTVGNLLAENVSFSRIPESLIVSEDFRLRHCLSLTSLPPQLHVGSANFDLIGNLIEIPENFIAFGDFTAHFQVSNQPNRITILGYLDWSYNPIPPYTFAYSMYCAGIQVDSIPETIHIQNDLDIEELEYMRRLPKTLNVYGKTTIFHHTFLEIPDGFVCKGSLTLDVRCQHCLPADMTICGDLTIYRTQQRLAEFEELLQHRNYSAEQKQQYLAAWKPNTLPVDARVLGKVQFITPR